jgi:hypothetical protein
VLLTGGVSPSSGAVAGAVQLEGGCSAGDNAGGSVSVLGGSGVMLGGSVSVLSGSGSDASVASGDVTVGSFEVGAST